MGKGDLKADWSFVDSIYLITTTPPTSDSSRLDRTRAQLEKVGMWGGGKVQVRTFEPDDEDRVRGCYTSHMNVLMDVKKSFVGRDDYKVLILEDNLETTNRMEPFIVESVSSFLEQMSKSASGWDVFHLAYMMYVPGLSLQKISGEDNIVQMLADGSSAVGTSAYVVSKSGVESLINNYETNGFVEAVREYVNM
jgi:hypothetical protein